VAQSARAKALRAAPSRGDAAGKALEPRAAAAASASSATTPKPRKLSYKEQRELDELPSRIEALEAEQKQLAAFLAEPESYVKEAPRVVQAQKRHAEIDDQLLKALERWEVLGAR
jgi:ATP-binding cassette subfamily F protein uup